MVEVLIEKETLSGEIQAYQSEVQENEEADLVEKCDSEFKENLDSPAGLRIYIKEEKSDTSGKSFELAPIIMVI